MDKTNPRTAPMKTLTQDHGAQLLNEFAAQYGARHQMPELSGAPRHEQTNPHDNWIVRRWDVRPTGIASAMMRSMQVTIRLYLTPHQQREDSQHKVVHAVVMLEYVTRSGGTNGHNEDFVIHAVQWDDHDIPAFQDFVPQSVWAIAHSEGRRSAAQILKEMPVV